MRQISAAQREVRRIRADRARRAPATSCDRCHLEPAIDTHELVRRSQYPGAALDVFVQRPIGRACHDWVGLHPQQAHDEGWVIWGWEYRAGLRDADDGDTVPAVPNPAPARSSDTPPAVEEERVAITLRLPRWLLDAAQKRADRHKLSRNAWLEMAIERVVSMPTQVVRGGTRRF